MMIGSRRRNLSAKIINYVFFLQMADIYDSSRGLVKIGPCSWSPNLDIGFWLSQEDDTILKVKEYGSK